MPRSSDRHLRHQRQLAPRLSQAKGDKSVTPLHLAAREGHMGAVRALVEAGAAIDAATTKRDDPDTPLSLAAVRGGPKDPIAVCKDGSG